MTNLDFVIYSLAVWRLSSLLCHEDGPKAVFRRMREFCETKGFELFFQLFQCVWCTSIWVGMGLLLLLELAPQIAFWLSLVLSWSAVSIGIQTTIEKVKAD